VCNVVYCISWTKLHLMSKGICLITNKSFILMILTLRTVVSKFPSRNMVSVTKVCLMVLAFDYSLQSATSNPKVSCIKLLTKYTPFFEYEIVPLWLWQSFLFFIREWKVCDKTAVELNHKLQHKMAAKQNSCCFVTMRQ